jgi:hypothetical protein
MKCQAARIERSWHNPDCGMLLRTADTPWR